MTRYGLNSCHPVHVSVSLTRDDSAQATNSFPKDLAAKVGKDESLVPKGDKKAMQRVMPFLQWVAQEVCC
jgi:hypothetical protein